MNGATKTVSEAENLPELLNLAIGYQKAKVLFTFVELGIADVLKEKSLTVKEMVEPLKINSLAMERFLNACVSVGLLEKSGENYSNSALSECFLRADAEFYLGGQINRYSERSFPIWADLTEHLKNWEYGAQEESAPESDDQGAEAMAEQHNFSLLHGNALAKAFDFTKYKKVLDLGGGTGAMSIGVCRRHENLRAVVFDLPQIIETTQRFVEKSNLQNRIETFGGDFQKDELPVGFDVALLANFMSVAEEADNKNLLSEIFDKLPSGGACILSGLILDDSRLAPQSAVLFCLEDICWNAPDVERSESVYMKWLSDAGFENIQCRMYLEPTKIIYGFKP